MSKFGECKPCMYTCGTVVYFDAKSQAGHPSPDVWIPLEIKEGRKTDRPHDCPKRKNGQTLDTEKEKSLPKEKTPATIAPVGSLEFAEQLIELLTEYITLKTKEQGEGMNGK